MCLSQKVGEMQTKAFHVFFFVVAAAVISDASFNEQNTSSQNVWTSTDFSPISLNTDESKFPRVTNIVIVTVVFLSSSPWFSCHCHRGFRVVAFLRTLAAFARLDNHVGKLFDLGCVANVVEDGERLQILGHTARRSRSFRIYGIVQTEDLGVLSVWTPQIRACPSTEVGIIPFGFMDPFPPKIPLEINVKRAEAAIILHISKAIGSIQSTLLPPIGLLWLQSVGGQQH